MKTKTMIKAGGSLALCVGLTAGGYGIAAAATSTTSPSGATGSSSSTAGGVHGHKHTNRRDREGGVITAVSSDSITIEGRHGTTKTITTTSTTRYTRDGVASSATALKVGERVEIIAVRPAGSPAASSPAASSPAANSPAANSVVAARVNIVDPRVAGTVQSVSGQTLVISTPSGFYRTVDLSGSTTYTNAGQTSTASSLAAGDPVVAVGMVAANHTDLDASAVAVNPVLHSGRHKSAASGRTTGSATLG